MIGTRRWMSPERFNAEPGTRLTPAGDVYAFGLLCVMVDPAAAFPFLACINHHHLRFTRAKNRFTGLTRTKYSLASSNED
jgi:serine/threonine protein kinase